MDIFDSNYYKGKRNLPYPLTKKQQIEYKKEKITLGILTTMAYILLYIIILPNL